VARFAVMSVALVITLGLGYLRFVRGRAAGGGGSKGAVIDGGVAEVERRLRELEDRLDSAASALGKRG
jgi:hypothetical protein